MTHPDEGRLPQDVSERKHYFLPLSPITYILEKYQPEYSFLTRRNGYLYLERVDRGLDRCTCLVFQAGEPQGDLAQMGGPNQAGKN